MLTEEQDRIVHSTAKHLRVLSAAGSGKTTVLAARMAQLCANGADPASILAITFTRRAGKELKDRLGPKYSAATVGTFHSTILQELQKSGNFYNVLDEFEVEHVLDSCARKLGLMSGGKYRKKSRSFFLKEISSVRSGKIPATPLSKLYMSTLAINGDLDFEGILVEGVRLAKSGGFNWVKHLFVDEAQDNEPLQWQLVHEISKHASVMVVGDTGQSLYSFRGAVPEHFEKLDWPCLEMTESFRFPSNIADSANAIGATPLKVVSNKPASPISIVRNADIVSYVKQIAVDQEYSDIAILCRYNSQVQQIRAELMSGGIPVVVPSIQLRGAIYNLLMALAAPGSATAREKLVGSWRDKRPRLVQYLASNIPQDSAASIIREWLSLAGGSVREILSALEIPESMRIESEGTIREYGDCTLLQYAAETSESEWIAEGYGVSVGTIHWSKGGQWAEVIVPFVNHGVWPRKSGNKEELRVLYVAITRTMERLHILHDDSPSEFLRFFEGVQSWGKKAVSGAC